MTKSKKIVIIVAISVIAVSIIAFFAIPVTVTLDYGFEFQGRTSYWARVEGENYQMVTCDYIKVRRFSKYSPPRVASSYFQGWYKDSACTVPWVNGEDKVSSNITLYAKIDNND